MTARNRHRLARARGIRRLRALGFAVLLLGMLVLLPACGGGSGGGGGDAGTVALLNQSDQGMAPLVVTQFFLAPVGTTAPGPNLLAQDVGPGGVVIIGLFPPGTYNAVAVLAGGLNVQFLDRVVVSGQPTNFIVPGP